MSPRFQASIIRRATWMFSSDIRGSAAEQAHLIPLEFALGDQGLRLGKRLLQQVRDPPEVLAQLLGHAWRAQAGRGMKERQHEYPPAPDQMLLRHAADLGDASGV